MNYIYHQDAVTFQLDSFKISEILECGQCFRFAKLTDNEYLIVAHNKVLHISQNANEIRLYPCSKEEFEGIWMSYFDLERDYNAIKSELSKDPILEEAVSFADGIRLLNQDTWECLISFIISQNMNIPRIKQIIKAVSEKYGTQLDDHYAFPSTEQLKNASQIDLAECKAGFRTKYILDAVNKINNGELNICSFSQKTTEELRKDLMSIYGVGNKVADCCMLFSCGRYEVFPTDVWVKRVMQNLYFDGKDIPIKEIHTYAKDKFGKYAGFAQQYLFHYARLTRIGLGG